MMETETAGLHLHSKGRQGQPEPQTPGKAEAGGFSLRPSRGDPGCGTLISHSRPQSERQ